MPTASGSLAFLGAARFQGYWNANSNNATGSGLTGGVTGQVTGLFLAGASTSNGGYALATGLTASAGDYWQVTGSGTHNVDGTTNWNLNDFCIYSGSAGGTGDWIKLAFEDTIASIVLGDLSSSSFHIGSADNDKHIIFASGSVHSGSDNFTFDYDSNNLLLTGSLHITGSQVLLRAGSDIATITATDGGGVELAAENGSLTLKSFGSDENVLVNAHLYPSADSVRALGHPALQWNTVYADNVALSGQGRIDLDADSDTSIRSVADDTMIFEVGSTDLIQLTDGTLELIGGDIKLSPTAISTAHITTTGSLALRANDNISIGDDDADSVRIGRTNTTLAKIHIRSGADTDLVVSDSKVGVGTDSPTFKLDVNGTTRHSDDVTVIDDKKVIFGTNSDAHIEYNKNGDDNLIISGSSSGMVLSGTIVQVSGNMIVKFPNYLAVTSNDSHSAASFYVQTGQGAQFHGGTDNGGVTIRDAGDVHIADDKKIIFGTGEESHIEYNENGDDFLIISGSHGGGTVISGSKLAFDSSTVASGTIAGPGSYLAVKSTGQVVLTSSTGQVSAVANGANNRIATFSSADALNGEANLTFDGTRLVLTGSLDIGAGSDDPTINFGLGDSTTPAMIKFDDAGDSSEYLIVSGSKLGGTQLQGSRVSIKPLQQDYGVIFETGDIVVADNVKLAFGATRDGHIEYNENGDDFLIISGSSKGAVLSGSSVVVAGASTFKDDVSIVDDKKLIFGTNSDASFEYDEDGTDTLLYAGASIRIPDDTKLEFGTGGDTHIEYNENGDDFLIISGSSKGVVLSGSSTNIDGNAEISGTLTLGGSIFHLDDEHTKIQLTDNKWDHFAGGYHMLSLDGDSTPKILKVGAADNASIVDFAVYKSALSVPATMEAVMYVSSSTGVIHFNQPIIVKDDTKLNFGLGSDAHIEYNENGDDFLIISGSSKGVALSGSVIALDGNTNVAGVLTADAGISGVHQLTGSLQITGSDGVSLQLKSTGSVSFRLEADTDNSDESQNPFIELVQDGGATDYTIGLTKGSRNPEGDTILHMTDNALALGSNIAIGSTNVGHVQFYNRATASFGLFDRGSTNHGTADLQGFRVGVGPIFSESNFPKGRMEIHNTSTSPVPALYLTVSGTSQPALITEAANTTRNIVEITGSSLTTGDMMVLYSDSSNTSDRTLLNITNDNASSEKVVLVQLTQDAFSYPAFIQRGGGTVKNLPTFNTSHATSQTIAITHLIEGSYFAVGRGAGTTDTTPTSAQIVARIKDAAVGDSFEFAYFNTGLTHDVTLAGGTNVKKLDGSAASFTIPAGKGRMFVFVLMNVGSGTEQVNMIPKSAAVDLFS